MVDIMLEKVALDSYALLHVEESQIVCCGLSQATADAQDRVLLEGILQKLARDTATWDDHGQCATRRGQAQFTVHAWRFFTDA